MPLKITKKTSFEDISKYVYKLREQKGKEKEVLDLVSEAMRYGHEHIVDMYFEMALTYQHLYMNNNSDRNALLEMEKSVLMAKTYAQKFGVKSSIPRVYRTLGVVENYKRNYKKAINYYKKAISHVKYDPDPFRFLELKGFLSTSLIMSGDYKRGYKMVKNLYENYFKSKMGKKLMKEDYQRWGIWLSGLVIRTINSLLDKNLNYDIKEMKLWLENTKRIINDPSLFSYRLMEFEKLWTKFQKLRN